MLNYVKEKQYEAGVQTTGGKTQVVTVPLPNGGISNEDVYETWYVYECPKCGRQVKESYRCEVLIDKR
jgi:hypothetical protein